MGGQAGVKSGIFCKNFFVLYLILYFLYKKQFNIEKKSSRLKVKIFCIPQSSNQTSFLRAPNRSKSAQISIKTRKFKLSLILCNSVNAFSPNFSIKDIHFMIFLFKKLKAKVNFFESNIFILKNIKITSTQYYNLL
jgi:hypothetical protein